MSETILVYCDGGARGNPGPAAIGFLIKTEGQLALKKAYRMIGITTNNVAEYQAVIEALQWLRDNKQIFQSFDNSVIQFFLDSNLVVNQLNGLFKVKDSRLRELLLKVRLLEGQINAQITYNYIPRKLNKVADSLVNLALDSVK